MGRPAIFVDTMVAEGHNEALFGRVRKEVSCIVELTINWPASAVHFATNAVPVLSSDVVARIGESIARCKEEVRGTVLSTHGIRVDWRGRTVEVRISGCLQRRGEEVGVPGIGATSIAWARVQDAGTPVSVLTRKDPMIWARSAKPRANGWGEDREN